MTRATLQSPPVAAPKIASNTAKMAVIMAPNGVNVKMNKTIRMTVVTMARAMALRKITGLSAKADTVRPNVTQVIASPITAPIIAAPAVIALLALVMAAA